MSYLKAYRHNLVVERFCKSLVVDIYSTLSNEWLYQITLAVLEDNEFDLNDGRFSNFNRNPFDHAISLTHNSTNEYFAPRNWFEDSLDWVAENIKGEWSVAVYSGHVGHLTGNWSFMSLSDALMFKLARG